MEYLLMSAWILCGISGIIRGINKNKFDFTLFNVLFCLFSGPFGFIAVELLDNLEE